MQAYIKKIALALCVCAGAAGQLHAQYNAPPGTYHTSWVGNSFGGAGTQTTGEWVQDAASKIVVSPDGTVIAGSVYDENGRCVGLYKNGQVNGTLLQEEPTHTAWGFGTASLGIAVNGDYIYDANTADELLVFSWTPGSISSVPYAGKITLSKTVTGMTSNGSILAVIYDDEIELRKTYNNDTSMSVTGSFSVSGATDAAIASDNSMWVLADGKVTHWTVSGSSYVDSDVTIPGLQTPVAVAFDKASPAHLMVTDNGSSQQVKLYNVSGTPTLYKSVGTSGGDLSSSPPGAIASSNFFALVGAGADTSGNVYVGMSFGNQPGGKNFATQAEGNFYLRSLTSSGTLNWSVFSGAYTDSMDFDPNANGNTIYSVTGIYNMNLNANTDGNEPGTEETLKDITLDPLNYPTDPRIIGRDSVLDRFIGTSGVPYEQLICTIPQTGQYMYFFNFGAATDSSNAILHQAGPTVYSNSSYALDIDADGGMWIGDTDSAGTSRGTDINYYKFSGWSNNIPSWPAQGSPTKTVVATSLSCSVGGGWNRVSRVKYDASSDTLYVTGYSNDNDEGTSGTEVGDGLCGTVMGAYHPFLNGTPTKLWTVSIPTDSGNKSAKAVTYCGGYLFLAMCDPTSYEGSSQQLVHIYNAATGAYVGTFAPNNSDVAFTGNVDIPAAIQAIERSSGEYLILVEDNGRAKNMLYRWIP